MSHTCTVNWFSTTELEKHNGKRTASSINGFGKIRYPHAEQYLTTYTKINSKLSKDFKVRPETTKLLQENLGWKTTKYWSGQ